jgi:thiamine biosynthesis lipoprotein
MRHHEPVMGTVVSFDVQGGAAGRGIESACALLHELDWRFSTWKSESAVSRLRRGELAAAEAPADVVEVLELCRRARALSRGFFDPWAMPGGVDPTGLVKGWAAGRALEAIRACGAEAAMVNAGGDIAVFGRPGGRRWRIGVRDPGDAGLLRCVVEVEAAIATSGAYERGAHIIDPRSGRPAARFASAAVVGPSLAMADALATALIAGGGHVLGAVSELPGYSACVIAADGVLRATAGFPAADPAPAGPAPARRHRRRRRRAARR